MTHKKVYLVALLVIITIAFFGCAKTGSETLSEQTAQQTTQVKHTNSQPQPESTPQVIAVSPTQTEAELTEEEKIQLIIDLVKTQHTAIINADEAMMEGTIYPADNWLMLETKHLVADQKILPVKDYTRSVSDIYGSDSYYYATMTQSFIYEGEERKSSELRLYYFDGNKAYDMGTALDKYVTGNVFLAYPEGEYEFAKNLGENTQEYVDLLSNKWKAEYYDPISIKIYGEKTTFLYSVKLSMPDWAGGWYERGESIKTYLYDTSESYYEYLVQHEATHMILSEVTNDNAAYWMQEGFATTMPGIITQGRAQINRIDALGEAMAQGRLPSVSEHIETNLELVTDIFDVRVYYGYSSAMVVYMLEKMDAATLLSFFEELKTYPYISLTMSEKVFDTQSITEKCLKKATGNSFEDFYADFDSWLIARLS